MKNENEIKQMRNAVKKSFESCKEFAMEVGIDPGMNPLILSMAVALAILNFVLEDPQHDAAMEENFQQFIARINLNHLEG